MIELLNGDCLDLMKDIPEKSIDMVLADLPYGKTKNEWDKIIDSEILFNKYLKIIKDNAPIILFAQDKFTVDLINACRKYHRYNLIWEKTTPVGFLNANVMPLRYHEDIVVFYKKKPIYNPQKSKGHKPVNSYTKHTDDGSNYGKTKKGISGGGSTERYPKSILRFKTDKQKTALAPTQKPVALCEYLIRTYSREGDTILDNTMGSGTTGVACINTNRNFIGIEKDEKYFEIAKNRIEQARQDAEPKV